mmetsp:Transcript_22216/g.47784  ORF Transcript_22216/g.47784 Transcript_22216/m.47784 type:complete len:471 (+) Transcript_22216:84-1496(+)|eukprot:CAMPEP_0172539430 /NCGR_PEP_ID=MMETSP1067-20121228/10624_1 /TAXON_ID=265564 ORGANISM="Thalassiosira punctigera, Strain Tpunct2005C2" /NCGR_SAMPLE_ID=MMETSP1067 /ASSEMBLY_ACC=CAM_ASM_000444 /LENGTH=470 /DNA_ID=CAMNT_0013325117 /DNA_START=48 /DNA_END=1460 /DNA_ORIENTATION=-
MSEQEMIVPPLPHEGERIALSSYGSITISGVDASGKESAKAGNKDCNVFDDRLRAGEGNAIIVAVEKATGPAPLCRCLEFYPTRAVITAHDQEGKRKGGGEHSRYAWSARDHRKMRFPTHIHHDAASNRHPDGVRRRLRILSWEPHNVTWWNCFVGMVGNTLWVVNGAYAVWPDLAKHGEVGATNIIYYTGVIGAGLYVITGYLGWVEAINHTHGYVRIPPAKKDGDSKDVRVMHCQHVQYGLEHHPLGFSLGRTMEREAMDGRVEYAPVVEKYSGDIKEMERNSDVREKSAFFDMQGYMWWTNHPDLCHIGIFNALVYFLSTLIFWIPAIVWLPMEELDDLTPRSEITWIYLPQIVPSVGFIYVGYAAMAEAAGSWTRPAFDAIGWWISFLNTIGGVGFLLYAVLALPSVVGKAGCCDELMRWGASMATFWGSCSFWVAGILQCVEFSSEHPITLGSASAGAPSVRKKV